MYNMYSQDYASPICNRLVMNPQEEKYSLGGAANKWRSCAQNDSFLVPHEKFLGSNPGRVQQIVLFKVILIDYYKHYNYFIHWTYMRPLRQLT